MGRDARTAEEILEHLFANATRLDNGCLISHLRPNKKGYIPVQVGGRDGDKWRANRFVLTMTSGKQLPSELGALHTCDNRACIEPSHLYAGTAQQNTDDMMARDRVARIGLPPTNELFLQEALRLREAGLTLKDIAAIQGLAGESSAADRIRRASNVQSFS